MQKLSTLSPREQKVENILSFLNVERSSGQNKLNSPDLTKLCDTLNVEYEKIYRSDKMRSLKDAGIVETHQDYHGKNSRFGLEELEQILSALEKHLKDRAN